MKKLITIIVYAVLWMGWFICYPYMLRWFEGASFFSTLPDYAGVHFHFPSEIFRYCGAFLLQFYAWPLAGAAIQAALAVLIILCIWSIVKRLFKDPDRLFWIPFLFLPAVVYLQLGDMTLEHTCAVLAIAALLAATVWGVRALRKFQLTLPAFMRKAWLTMTVPALAALLSLYFVYDGPMGRQHEEIARLEYLGEHQQWTEILETVPLQESLTNTYKRKYVLLALAETGKLADYAFRYGLSGSGDFMFQNADGPLSLNFNTIFYRSLCLANPVVYCAYQQSLQSLPGISFDALRTLTDMYLDNRDYDLAKKYMDILDHSLTHGKWVKERLPKLEAIRDAEPLDRMTGEPFILEDFINDMSSLVSRYPDNARYADYLLCGLLADRDGGRFYDFFRFLAPRLYPDGNGIPHLYQEALLLIASQDPRILDIYHIDEEVWKRFTDFTGMMQNGKTAQAKKKYAGTYWAYVY